VARVLVADMAYERTVIVHEPTTPTWSQAIELISRVLDGLRKL
jgi:hypothetical protein